MPRRCAARADHVEVWSTRDPFGFPVDRVLAGHPVDREEAWATFLEALDGFDVFHFHFARSLLMPVSTGLPPFWDLPVYRALGKKVFFTFHGSDCRTRRIHEQVNPWSLYGYAVVPGDDDVKEKAVQVIRTYANRMFVVSVSLHHFVPDAEYLPRVLDLADWPVLPPSGRSRPLVVHVASSPLTKGTPIIREGLRRLADEGLDFELRILEEAPHADVRAALAEADILVDNVIAGSYGVSSMEAMASGRVSVANLSDEVLAAHPDCPVVHVDPPGFVDTMRTLILDPAERGRRAGAGRAYIARVHDAPLIAARLLEAYREPERPPVRVAMPDWMSYEGRRRLEIVEERLGRAQAELSATRRRESALRERLGLPPVDGVAPSMGRRLRSAVRRAMPSSVAGRIDRLRHR